LCEIAIVIVTWNKLSSLKLLLGDIANVEKPSSIIDVYIVDNASTDGTSDWIENHCQDINLIRTEKNCGGSGGFSLGLKATSELNYSYIWLLDDDVRLDSESLVKLVAVLQQHPDIGIVGSQIRKLNQPDFIQELGSKIYQPKAHLLGLFANEHYTKISSNNLEISYLAVDVVAAASLLVRASLVRKMGYFENYFLHFDDVEWCLRAGKYGMKVAAAPGSIVWHDSPDCKIRPWISYYDERNLCYCFEKHRPELLRKRLFVVFPKLLYYSLTGRQFWVEAYINGYYDFLNGIQGQMPADRLTYHELALAQAIPSDSTAVIQPEVALRLSAESFSDQNALAWQVPSGSLLSQLMNCYGPNRLPRVDYAVLSCQCPFWPLASRAHRVVFYTGSGFIPGNATLGETARDMLRTGCRLLVLYWIFSKRKFTST
jgi:GT2 family glycosyltransferase